MNTPTVVAFVTGFTAAYLIGVIFVVYDKSKARQERLDKDDKHYYPYTMPRVHHLKDEIFLTLLRGMPNATMHEINLRTERILEQYLGAPPPKRSRT